MKTYGAGRMIKHLPKKRIAREDRMYLGYADNYDVVLAIEDWEIRIYNYEYWSDDAITDWEHEDEDWREPIDDYFGWVEWNLDVETCEYLVADFESNDPNDMAKELLYACTDELEDRSWTIYDLDDNNDAIPSQKLVDFLRRCLVKTKEYQDSLAYAYYK